MFTSGFFNSVNSDRRYNAEQMSAIFDGLITQGIFDSIGDHFQVRPGSGLTVTVGTGRAWLNQTWSYNDSLYPLQLSAASPTLGRKDLVCLKVDKTTAVRANSLVLIEGTPASTPTEPTVTDDPTNGVYYHKLAAVTVPAGATSVSDANIQNYIGLSTGTPYVTGLVSTTAVDELWSQWDGEFNDWWENSIKPIINTETVTRLQNNIDHITAKEATMNLYGYSHINPPPSGKTYQEYSTDAVLNKINTLLNQKASASTVEQLSTAVAGKADIALTSENAAVLYNKCLWKKNPIIPPSYTIGTAERTQATDGGSDSYATTEIKYSASISVSDAGIVSLQNPTTYGAYYNGYSTFQSYVRGKYFTTALNNHSTVYFVESNATVIANTSPYRLFIPAAIVTGIPKSYSDESEYEWGTETSHTDGGESGGYKWTNLGKYPEFVELLASINDTYIPNTISQGEYRWSVSGYKRITTSEDEVELGTWYGDFCDYVSRVLQSTTSSDISAYLHICDISRISVSKSGILFPSGHTLKLFRKAEASTSITVNPGECVYIDDRGFTTSFYANGCLYAENSSVSSPVNSNFLSSFALAQVVDGKLKTIVPQECRKRLFTNVQDGVYITIYYGDNIATKFIGNSHGNIGLITGFDTYKSKEPWGSGLTAMSFYNIHDRFSVIQPEQYISPFGEYLSYNTESGEQNPDTFVVYKVTENTRIGSIGQRPYAYTVVDSCIPIIYKKLDTEFNSLRSYSPTAFPIDSVDGTACYIRNESVFSESTVAVKAQVFEITKTSSETRDVGDIVVPGIPIYIAYFYVGTNITHPYTEWSRKVSSPYNSQFNIIMVYDHYNNYIPVGTKVRILVVYI